MRVKVHDQSFHALVVPNAVNHRQSGFTLIELVMVIIILGVLSVSVIGLFATRDDYASVLVKNTLLSSARLAQQAALAREAGGPVTLAASLSGGNWQFVVSDAAASPTTLATRTAEQANTSLHTSTTDFASACSALPAAPFTISFDHNGDTGGNQRICVTGDVAAELCIAPTGYAYDGACIQ